MRAWKKNPNRYDINLVKPYDINSVRNTLCQRDRHGQDAHARGGTRAFMAGARGVDGRIIDASCRIGYPASHLRTFDSLTEILAHIFHSDRRLREEIRLGESEFSIRDKKVIAILFFASDDRLGHHRLAESGVNLAPLMGNGRQECLPHIAVGSICRRGDVLIREVEESSSLFCGDEPLGCVELIVCGGGMNVEGPREDPGDFAKILRSGRFLGGEGSEGDSEEERRFHAGEGKSGDYPVVRSGAVASIWAPFSRCALRKR